MHKPDRMLSYICIKTVVVATKHVQETSPDDAIWNAQLYDLMFCRKAEDPGLRLQMRLFSTGGVGFRAGSTTLP